MNLGGIGVEMGRKSRVSARLGTTLSVCPRLFIQSQKRNSRKVASGFGEWHHALRWKGLDSASELQSRRKERTMHKMRTAARRVEQPPFGRQVAFARVATGLAWTGLGALAVGASAAGALAIGALAIRALAVKRGRIERLDIEELEVGRLHVRELVVEQERRPIVEQEQPSPQQGV
jgi:hypothetical protein